MAQLPKAVVSILCIFYAALLTLKQIKAAIRKSGKHLTCTTTNYMLKKSDRVMDEKFTTRLA